MVTDTGEVADTTAADQHDGVLLKVVTFTTDVGGNFLAIGESNTGNLAKCRVGLLGCHGSYLQAYTSTLWAGIHVTDLGLHLGRSAWLADKLVNRWHSGAPEIKSRSLSGPSRKAKLISVI